MSNDATLFGGDSLVPEWLVIYTDDEDPSDSEESLLAAEYCVPLFWLALFSEDDLRHADHFDDGEPFPYLSAVRSQAVERYRARKEFLSFFLSTASQYFDRWERYLAGLPHRHLSVDFCEIAFTVEGVEENVIRALRCFEDPSRGHIDALAATMSVPYDPRGHTFDSPNGRSVDHILGFSRKDPDLFFDYA